MPELRLPRRHEWALGIASGVVAVAALVGGKNFGNVHAHSLNPKLVAWISAGVLVVFGFVAVRRLSDAIGRLVSIRTITTAGMALRLVLAVIGYILIIIGDLEVLGLGVTVDHVLVGAGFAGVVLGIAAQQSLGNVFAALVLLLARPFKVGDRIRIRSGALGGVFEARVLEIGLVYVTVSIEGEVFKLPNSAILAAGVGQMAEEAEAAAPPGENRAAPGQKPS